MARARRKQAGRALLRALAVLAVVAWTACPFAARAASGNWEWTIAPYVWGVSTTMDSRFSDAPDRTTRVDGILDTLDGAFQLHVEGSDGQWGGFADFTYLGLSDARERAGFQTETDFDTRLFELAATWHPEARRDVGLDLFAGLRYADFDFTARLVPADPQRPVLDARNQRTYSDVMLGARYTWALSERWLLTVRGDSSWGQTDGTWNASAVLRYRTRNGEWLLGYRYLQADFSDNGNDLHLTADGPEIGYGFRF